jgi:hypothetical protein
MKRVVLSFVAFGVAVFFVFLLLKTAPAADPPADKPADQSADKQADAPADRVVVMYFHRTKRCPTCQKMGGYSEEAVTKGFADQIKDGKVEFHYIDFQAEENAEIVKSYKIAGPTLIVVRVAENKTAEYKNLTEIWSKVRDKEAFLKYVQDNVRGYMEAK